MKFDDMPYSRPDVEKTKADAAAIIERIKNAPDFAAADAAMMEFENLSGHIGTLATLATVRHQINTTDEYYNAENDFCDEQMPLLEEVWQAEMMAMYESKFRADFEKKYGSLMFKNIEIQLKTFSPEIVPDMQEENKLSSEYDKLIASAQIPFEGGVYTLSQMTPFKQSADDKIRRAAWEAEGQFYLDHGEDLDRIYDELVKLRTKMGRKLGRKDFVELGYDRMNRNCYTREDVDKFRAAIVKYIVPTANEFYRRQAKRLGFDYPLTFSDMAIDFRGGNAKPQGTSDDILATAKKFYHELSPETAKFIDMMYENELFDVLSRKGKAGGGFCTDIPDYKCPFIFANFNGTQGDVEVMTHEAGHAFAAYTASVLDIQPSSNQSPTLESCEIHSMSMEFFSWPWADEFFGKDNRKFRYSHLAGAITFLPYGTMVDHFQHSVYDNPDWTPAQRHDEWRRLLGIYMPWVKLGEIPFYGDGKGWQRQMHIYQVPFYYIDYCLAQTVALEFWALMQEDRTSAWKRYYELVKQAGTKTFDGLVQSANLDTPFGDAALKHVADAAMKWIVENDVSDIQ